MIEQLYHQYYCLLWQRAYHLTRCQELAEDIVQDTFVRAMSRGYQHQQYLGAWLWRITTNLAYDALRKQHTRHKYITQEPLEDHENHLVQESECDLIELQDILNSLPADVRDTLAIRLSGKNGDEAAEALGINRATWYRRIRKAKQQVQRALWGEEVA